MYCCEAISKAYEGAVGPGGETQKSVERPTESIAVVQVNKMGNGLLGWL